MKSGVPIMLGIAGGYLLGRSRKMKWALVIGGLVAGKRAGGMAGELLGSSPELSKLTNDVRGRLLEAGRSAAMAAASNRLDSFSDRLHERAESLVTPAAAGVGSSAKEAPEEQEREQEQEQEPQPAAKASSGARQRTGSAPRGRTTSRRSTSGGRTHG